MAGKGRASGKGTVRKHPNRELYEARLLIPRELRASFRGGTNLSFYANSQEDALEKRDRARRDLLDNPRSFDARRVTLGEYLERWVEGPCGTPWRRRHATTTLGSAANTWSPNWGT